MAHIVVVGDDPDISDLIRHYLEMAGHSVECLASGVTVMPRLRRGAPDLLVCDLMLPHLDGLLVCQAMRADPATASTPIIMVTARAESPHGSRVWTSAPTTT